MLVVPGSHRLSELVIPGPERILDGSPETAALEAAGLDHATAVELEPGDVALWSTFPVHGSGPNATSGDRRFCLNGYVRTADCDGGEWAFRDGESVALVAPTLVHYEDLFERPDPHYIEDCCSGQNSGVGAMRTLIREATAKHAA
jgi:Phytanoyl-CoA dioxygenase (PhyH)